MRQIATLRQAAESKARLLLPLLSSAGEGVLWSLVRVFDRLRFEQFKSLPDSMLHQVLFALCIKCCSLCGENPHGPQGSRVQT